MKSAALVLDLDGTLYCWMDAFALAIDAQITYIAKKTGFTKKRIQSSFKIVFQRHGSVEVMDAAKELDIWMDSNLSQEEICEIVSCSDTVFKEEFSNNLVLFSDVKETLDWAVDNKILLTAFSDARAFWVGFRLESLGIADYFERIYVMEDEITVSAPPQYKQMITLPEPLLKPNTFVLEEIIKEYQIIREKVYYVGDSKDKDIRTANLAGVNGIWARYGKNCSKKSRHILSSITHWTRGQINRGNNIKPKYTIDEFSDIKGIIKV